MMMMMMMMMMSHHIIRREGKRESNNQVCREGVPTPRAYLSSPNRSSIRAFLRLLYCHGSIGDDDYDSS